MASLIGPFLSSLDEPEQAKRPITDGVRFIAVRARQCDALPLYGACIAA